MHSKNACSVRVLSTDNETLVVPTALTNDCLKVFVRLRIYCWLCRTVGLQGRRQTSCNASSTQLCGSCRTVANTTDDWPTAGVMFYASSTVRPTTNSPTQSTVNSKPNEHWLDPVHAVGPGLQVPAQHDSRIHGLELCRLVSSIVGQQQLWSVDRGQLYVPRVRLSTYGGRAFSHAGPSAWNALPDHLKDNTYRHLAASSNISFYSHTQRFHGLFYGNTLFKSLYLLICTAHCNVKYLITHQGQTN